jgi:hypothetical protein
MLRSARQPGEAPSGNEFSCGELAPDSLRHLPAIEGASSPEMYLKTSRSETPALAPPTSLFHGNTERKRVGREACVAQQDQVCIAGWCRRVRLPRETAESLKNKD